jgi:aspartate/methionine/tyrosine aminotransferase
MADLAREIECRGGRIIKLQTGDPDFATPESVITAAYEAMKAGYTHYTGSRGLPELRQALAAKLRRENSIEYDADTEILVTHGAAQAISITLQTLLAPGDEVLLIEPYYMSYASSVILAGGVPVGVETDPGKDFALDLDRVNAAITPRSRLLVLNSPCNPSGIVLRSEEMAELARIAERYDLYILCDDVYEKLLYDGARHTSMAALPGMGGRTITINSLSKTYAMTGWRLGYLAAPQSLVGQMLKVLQYSATSIAPFSQMAALAALTNPELPAFIEMVRQTYDRRRRLGMEAVAQTDGLKAIRPRGAFYLMIDVSHYCRDSVDFTQRLLEKAHVAAVPGVAYGKSAEGWIRLTFAVPEETLVEGINRIGDFARSHYGRG